MMQNNIIHSMKLVETGEEPVTVDQIKEHFNIDFVNKDALIALYGKAARKAIENVTGLALVAKTVTIAATVWGHYSLELPVSPVASITSVSPIDGTGAAGDPLTDSGFSNFGAHNEQLTINSGGLYEITYEAEPGEVPPDLQLAICAQAAYYYENRGEVDGQKGVCLLAETLAFSYIRFAV